MSDADKRAIDDAINKAIEKAIKICRTPTFHKWDGNGGHRINWAQVGQAVAGAVIVAVVLGASSALFNRTINTGKLEAAIAKIDVKITDVSVTVDEMQRFGRLQAEYINRNTDAIGKHLNWNPMPAPIPCDDKPRVKK